MEVDGRERCAVELLCSGPPPGCKLMASGVAARVAFLEARMLGFARALEAAEGEAPSTPVGVPTQVHARCPGGVSSCVAIAWRGRENLPVGSPKSSWRTCPSLRGVKTVLLHHSNEILPHVELMATAGWSVRTGNQEATQVIRQG